MKRSYLILCAVIALFLSVQLSHAFDTGHHTDLVTNALKKSGYGDRAIKVVLTGGWFNDYFSYLNPLAGASGTFQRLHMDSLFGNDFVKLHFDHLIINTQNLVRELSTSTTEPRLRFLLALGSSLHVMQDFYTHSNWVETHPKQSCGCYRSDTWFHNDDQRVNKLPQYVTGACPDISGFCPKDVRLLANSTSPQHGEYCDGLASDSYAREGFIEAYLFGFSATMEWIKAVESFVEVDFVGGAKTFNGDFEEALNKEIDFAYRLSLWSDIPIYSESKKDGNWKGPKSGSSSRFTAKAIIASAEDNAIRKNFFDAKIHDKLAARLYDFTPPTVAVPDVAAVTTKIEGANVFILRTLRVRNLDRELTPPDFFARITVNGQTFVEATWRNEGTFSPFWTVVKVLDDSDTVVNIRYDLLDEEVAEREEIYDINPNALDTGITATFDIATQTLTVSGGQTGQFDSPQRVLSVSGNDDKSAQVTLFAKSVKLGCGSAPSLNSTLSCSIAECDLGYPKGPYSFCSLDKPELANVAGNNVHCFPDLCSPNAPPTDCSQSAASSLSSGLLFVLVVALLGALLL